MLLRVSMSISVLAKKTPTEISLVFAKMINNILNQQANGDMDRFIYFNLFEVFNSKKKQREKIIRKLEWLQWKLHIGRKIPVHFPKLNGSSGWWTLSSNCLKYVVDYSNKNPGFLKSFKYTLCAEEMFFQTILMNSRCKKIL
jgi:hypothetical protein